MTAISLGMPSVPTKLAERRKSRQIQVGTVPVGGDAPVSVQSMTTTRTSDIGATLQQIAELTASGCQIVRVACPTQDDADALATIARKSQIPVIADIHFQPKYVFAAIEAGSVKHNDPVVMIEAYRQLAEACEYPLHLGVTEAGPAFQGTIKSAVAFGALLSQGIGDTIRVSLSAPPAEEVKVGLQILESLGLKERGLEIVSCPSCGRAQVDVYKLAEEVTAGLEGMEVPLRVAVMGCVVNGPGEAREADLGVASGNGKGQIFVKGEVIKTVPESKIVETLIDEAMKLAEQMESAGTASGEPSVTVAG
ncbi:flavodoxin/ferredoxin-dependent (E)-4-hydroxy-3-methylbut-2-enyl-diphosphate synthase [Streptomyces sp. NRRL F-6674]|uniref:flavodoxin/ferredoxin-dependent (E)-4-hydroxy-3-methylbut-2-enyl-diphosphate synthase n=1 Tax=Streptomyces sp. NRRL F-6674 TaxID=1463877 RepID=UPI0007C5C9BE|nr:flavodoxin/ferredoxin-dependent (E)-4-hydroxy-3-methylbut-2-enyl-diphosphate synthase [Streptomyces sp. NRRL F-6674]